MLNKVSSVMHFDYLSSQAWFCGIICLRCQKNPLKNEVTKRLLNVAYWLKTLKFLLPAFHKIAISTKP